MSEKLNIPDGDYQWTPSVFDKKWRKWMGTILIEDGMAFVSPRIAGMKEEVAIMCCGYDGVPFAQVGPTIVVSADWLIKEKPACRENIQIMIGRLVEQEGHQ